MVYESGRSGGVMRPRWWMRCERFDGFRVGAERFDSGNEPGRPDFSYVLFDLMGFFPQSDEGF